MLVKVNTFQTCLNYVLDIDESKDVFSLLSLQKKQKRIKVNV